MTNSVREYALRPMFVGRILLVSVCLPLALCASCATFSGFEGGGPLQTREALPEKFQGPVPPEKMEQLRAQAQDKRPFMAPAVWVILVPGKHTRVENMRTAFLEWDSYGLGLLVGHVIFFGGEMALYKVDPPEISSYMAHTEILLGYLFRRSETLYPNTHGPSAEPGPTGYRYVRYCTLVDGLIGWGRVNHQRYFQFLWIPIPVGRVE